VPRGEAPAPGPGRRPHGVRARPARGRLGREGDPGGAGAAAPAGAAGGAGGVRGRAAPGRRGEGDGLPHQRHARPASQAGRRALALKRRGEAGGPGGGRRRRARSDQVTVNFLRSVGVSGEGVVDTINRPAYVFSCRATTTLFTWSFLLSDL
jgi:hypothetical protein